MTTISDPAKPGATSSGATASSDSFPAVVGTPAPDAAAMPPVHGARERTAEGAGGPPALTSDGLDYWQGRDIPADDRAGFDYLGTVLRGSGVRQSVANAAVDWLYSARALGDDLTTQSAAHRYDLSRYGFSGIDAAYVNHLANALHAKGATQREVEALLNAYVDGQRRAAKRSAPATAKAVKDKPGQEMGLDEIRHVMQADRKRYNADARMQERYRELLRGG